MGLDFSHGEGMRYSTFGLMRRAIADDVLGIDLDEMEGYKKNINESLPILWYPYRNHPLYPLLRHSDCDGTLSVEHMIPIIQAFKIWIATIDPESDRVDMAARSFLQTMENAVEYNEELEFM